MLPVHGQNLAQTGKLTYAKYSTFNSRQATGSNRVKLKSWFDKSVINP